MNLLDTLHYTQDTIIVLQLYIGDYTVLFVLKEQLSHKVGVGSPVFTGSLCIPQVQEIIILVCSKFVPS